MRRLFLLLPLLTLTGCPSLGPIDIPCASHDHCARDTFCSATGRCEADDHRTPVTEPTPVLTSITPPKAPVGSPGVTVILNGSNLRINTNVYWDDTLLPGITLENGVLSAPIPAELLATARVATLTVRTPDAVPEGSQGLPFTVENPHSTALSVSPASALAGSPDTVLTVRGSGFVRGATVYLGETGLTTRFVSSQELSATVTMAALSQSGRYRVTVRNPAPTEGDTSNVTFSIEPRAKTFVGGYSGDDGPALTAALARAWKGALSPTGELYYAEPERSRVMKIDTRGKVRRVAGTGLCGFNGDGGRALEASLCSPLAVAFDPAGNLLIADTYNGRLRKVDANGNISTVAGTGDCFNGTVGPATQVNIGEPREVKVAPNGNIFFSSRSCNRHTVFRISDGQVAVVAGGASAGYSGDNGPAIAAQVNTPDNLAVDNLGQVYIADGENHRVRRVSALGIITTLAGNGASGDQGNGGPATAAELGTPSGLWLDQTAQQLYITQYDVFRIRKLDLTSGTLSHFAGSGSRDPLSGDGGPATLAAIGHPSGIVRAANGTTYFFSVHDWSGGDRTVIKQVDPNGKLSTLAGQYPSTNDPLQTFLLLPQGVAVDAAGSVYYADTDNDRIWKRTANGLLMPVAGTGIRNSRGDGEQALAARLELPMHLSFDSAGNLYFAEWSGRIRRIDPPGIITTVAGGGAWPQGCPEGAPVLAPPGAGPGYNCLGDDSLATAAILQGPTAAVRSGNALYISENAGRIRRVDLTTGRISTLAGSTVTGNACGFVGDNGPAKDAKLCEPAGLAFDAQGDLLIADSYNRRLRKVAMATGRITTIAGGGEPGEWTASGSGGAALSARFGRPSGLVVDPGGAIYFTDSADDAVHVLDGQGVVTRWAGQSGGGLGGDEGPALKAFLATPKQLALGVDGKTLYVAEMNGHRIRQVGP
ncbi:MAG: IPT/TIG domain-containing protein [Myxococcaceae bacterium]